MPWDQAAIARYPRLVDGSIKGKMILAVARRAYNIHQPRSNWNEVNPEMRSWWCEITDTILRAAKDHAHEQQEKQQHMEETAATPLGLSSKREIIIPFLPYLKHLTGCSCFEGVRCDCGLHDLQIRADCDPS